MISFDAIVDAAALVLDVPRDEITSTVRTLRAVEARRAVFLLADRNSGLGVRDLAERLHTSLGSAYAHIRQLEAEVAIGRGSYLDEIEATAEAIQRRSRYVDDMVPADAPEVAYRVLVNGERALSDRDLIAMALAVLRSTPPADNPAVTALALAAFEPDATPQLRAAAAALMGTFDLSETPFQ